MPLPKRRRLNSSSSWARQSPESDESLVVTPDVRNSQPAKGELHNQVADYAALVNFLQHERENPVRRAMIDHAKLQRKISKDLFGTGDHLSLAELTHVLNARLASLNTDWIERRRAGAPQHIGSSRWPQAKPVPSKSSWTLVEEIEAIVAKRRSALSFPDHAEDSFGAHSLDDQASCDVIDSAAFIPLASAVEQAFHGILEGMMIRDSTGRGSVQARMGETPALDQDPVEPESEGLADQNGASKNEEIAGKRRSARVLDWTSVITGLAQHKDIDEKAHTVALKASIARLDAIYGRSPSVLLQDRFLRLQSIAHRGRPLDECLKLLERARHAASSSCTQLWNWSISDGACSHFSYANTAADSTVLEPAALLVDPVGCDSLQGPPVHEGNRPTRLSTGQDPHHLVWKLSSGLLGTRSGPLNVPEHGCGPDLNQAASASASASASSQDGGAASASSDSDTSSEAERSSD